MLNRSKNIIGVFDSGLGGLTVLKEFLFFLPNYNYIYLEDNARVPYGEKTQEQIYQYTREAVDFLFNKGCRLIIIACNTASSQALRRIQQEHLPVYWPDRKVLGVIRPLAEHVAQEVNKFGKTSAIGVIGTKATTKSGAYTTELRKLLPTARIIVKSAPLLVPLIEEDWSEKPETTMILKKYLRSLKQGQIAALLLACTHYSFLIKKVRQFLGSRVYVPEPGVIIAKSLKDYLSKHSEINLIPDKKHTRQFFFTDANEDYRQLAQRFLKQEISMIESANIKV